MESTDTSTQDKRDRIRGDRIRASIKREEAAPQLIRDFVVKGEWPEPGAMTVRFQFNSAFRT